MWRDVLSLLLKGKWIDGSEVEAFETEFAGYIGVPHAVATPSARAGVEMILKTLDIPPGGRIAIPAYTADCIPAVIQASGYSAVFVDIDPRDHNISIEALERTACGGIDAAIITHLFGRPCRMDVIMPMAERHDFIIIEDFSHSIGAACKGKKTGSFGAAGVCTFSTTKYFNTFGGGMVTANDPILGAKLKTMARTLPAPTRARVARAVIIAALMKLLTSPLPFSAIVFPAQLLLSLFSSDMLNIYNPTLHRFKEPRCNGSRYANLQGYIGRQWLQRIDRENKERTGNALLLNKLLHPSVVRLEDPPDCDSIYWLYILMVDNPVSLSNLLLRAGIDTGKFFMGNCADESFPNTEHAVRHTLQIPVNPEMDKSTITRISEVVNKAHQNIGSDTLL
jgi:dTDP-4-amino-4,6-dideoxygalactose transaminase